MKEYQYIINGHPYTVTLNKLNDNGAEVEVNGKTYTVAVPKTSEKPVAYSRPAQGHSASPVSASVVTPAAKPNSGPNAIKSPLPGIILSIDCKVGDTIKKGQKLLILEAMKMENSITSDRDGTVSEILINKGDTVLEGVDLLIIS